jgi:hypothetical protein
MHKKIFECICGAKFNNHFEAVKCRKCIRLNNKFQRIWQLKNTGPRLIYANGEYKKDFLHDLKSEINRHNELLIEKHGKRNK